MKKVELFGLAALSVLLIGIASADMPSDNCTHEDFGWEKVTFPAGTPPVTWQGYSQLDLNACSAQVLRYTDVGCAGDVAVFYDGGEEIARGSPAVRDPFCLDQNNPDFSDMAAEAAYYDDHFSHACAHLQNGPHSITAQNIQSWDESKDSDAYFFIGYGNCPGEAPVPEFPSVILPVALLIGFLGAVLYIQRTKEN